MLGYIEPEQARLTLLLVSHLVCDAAVVWGGDRRIDDRGARLHTDRIDEQAILKQRLQKYASVIYLK